MMTTSPYQFDNLPVELICEIADHLDCRALSILARTSAYLNKVVTPRLYKKGAANRYLTYPCARTPKCLEGRHAHGTAAIFTSPVSAWAVYTHETGVLRRLLEHGLDPNTGYRGAQLWGRQCAVCSCAFAHFAGQPLAQLAAWCGHWDQVRLLLAFGARGCAPRRARVRPLIHRLVDAPADVLRAALAAGAGADLEVVCGGTVLRVALDKGRLDLVEILLSAGASPDPVDDWESTPLTSVICDNNLPAILMLLEAGADVERRDIKGTPLYWALECPNPDCAVINTLIEAGADPHAIVEGEMISTWFHAKVKSKVAWLPKKTMRLLEL